jgi:hypothetical protein
MSKFLFSLLFPILLLAGWVIKLEYQTQSGQEVRIRIKGYDPRDLLSGHFIRYRLDLEAFDPCPDDSDTAICLCLNSELGSQYQIVTSSLSCESENTGCRFRLKGDCHRKQFLAGVERYSIPENLAPVLATLPQNSSVILSLDYEGNGIVKKVLVGEETLEEYAIKQLADQKK